ncbi:response regulator transcription factor [Aureibacillus halotolerans]|uniref:Response regulator receiver domain-containing protein n=1 Tax=Aureibacillus halotolerans TaxID=1508390 RepID=A0A4R6TXJ9_9BACI|nr:response regulator transcription factor [Aureibacillus halotolerans]TDQ36729.1 response regulator receiver domain-containing protein [Aureibacillus halotolerans]
MGKILVVDDEEVLRMLIVDTLSDEGHVLYEAADGIEALEMIQEHSFDLIILDYMMPGMTGIEVAEQLSDEWKKKNNILMLSAKTQQQDIAQSKAAGIHYYFPKPFSPIELASFVNELINE